MPTAAICIAMIMNSRNESDSSTLSCVFESSSSQTTGSLSKNDPFPSSPSAAREISESISSIAIEPSSSMSSSRRSAITTLASWRAMSQSSTSPSGRRAAPFR